MRILQYEIKNTASMCNNTNYQNQSLRTTLYWLFIMRMETFGMITSEDVHIELGNYYGYPKCCIDNFIELDSLGLIPGKTMRDVCKENNIPETHEGYVLCLDCSIKIAHKRKL